MDQALVSSIRKSLEAKSTAELREAYEAGDETAWSPEAFEAMRQLLDERSEKPARSPALGAVNSGGSVAGFFLFVGAGLCLLGCVAAVVKTLYGLWMVKQVAPILPVSTSTDSILVSIVILLDGFVSFCLSAALFVVFVRVSRLK